MTKDDLPSAAKQAAKWRAPDQTNAEAHAKFADFPSEDPVIDEAVAAVRGQSRMTNQPPATINPGALTNPADIHLVPALIANAGDRLTTPYSLTFP